MFINTEESPTGGLRSQAVPVVVGGSVLGILGTILLVIWLPHLRELYTESHLSRLPDSTIYARERYWSGWSFLPKSPLSKILRRTAPPSSGTYTLRVGPRFPREEFRHVSAFVRFEEIQAKDCPLTGDDLRALRDVPNVGMLDLEGTLVDDAGLIHIAKIPISRLSIANTSVSDTGLTNLATHVALRESIDEFDARGTKIRGPGFADFNGSSLTVVLLADSQFDDSGLSHLESIVYLRELDLSGTHITDAGISGFMAPRNLKSISLDRTAVSREGLRRFFSKRKADDLNLISLGQTLLTSEDVSRFSCDPEYLSLAGTGVDDEVVPWLVSRSRLNHVNLSHTKLTDAGLDALAEHPDLNYVEVEGCAISEAAKRRFISKRTRYDPNSTSHPRALATPLSPEGIEYRMQERWERYQGCGYLDRTP